MEAQNQQLTVKQQKLLIKIQRDGDLSPVSFVKCVLDFKKIKDFDHLESRQMIGLILTKAANLSGIKEPIHDINKTDIIEMFFMKYSNISFEEIEYAFKNNRFSGKPIEHFQLFNSEYVAKIIEKYLELRREIRHHHNLKLKKPDHENGVTEEDKKAIHNEFISFVFNEIENNNFCDSAWLLWEDLENKINIPSNVKKRLYRQQLYLHKKYKPRKQLINNNEDEVVINRCKSIIVSNYLKRNPDCI